MNGNNIVAKIIFFLTLLGGLGACIKPLILVTSGVKTTAVVTLLDQRDFGYGNSRDIKWFNEAYFIDTDGDTAKFDYSSDESKFSGVKEVGDEFEIIYRKGKPSSLMENDPISLYMLPLALLGVAFVVLLITKNQSGVAGSDK